MNRGLPLEGGRRRLTPSAIGTICALFLAAIAAAGDFTTSAIGTAGSDFLLIDVGARGIGMGGAFTAVANDATSMYWNPAGLAQIPQASASFMHNLYLAGINFDYLSYAQRITDEGVLGGAVRYMNAGSIPETDINGNSLGSFTPQSFVAEVGYGQAITDLADFEKDVTMGVTGRYLRTTMVQSADAFAADIGVQTHYYNGPIPYHVGFVAQNMGRGTQFDQTRDSLPFRFKVGAAADLTKTILVSLDGVFPVDNGPYVALGGEFALEVDRDMRGFLRLGLDSQKIASDLNEFRGINFGLGLKVQDFSFDYAFTPYGVLGNAHQFSISWNLPSKVSRRYRYQ